MDEDIKLMTKDELEKEQVILHDEYEKRKEKCYEEYLAMTMLSERYIKIDEELNKRNGKNIKDNDKSD